ncbi:unnamed protein product [Effrenium voratum]|uniref:Uncharacterized protein n=1 Tax=Effrenium voratum TaxID=2562239 RepID=A0AA36MIF8_9DINO|nr:unnamed protein product [Effrenium voratum]
MASSNLGVLRLPLKPEVEDNQFSDVPCAPSLGIDLANLKTPRSSYYTWKYPTGLPEGALAPPNRQMHDRFLEKLGEFQKVVEAQPQRLKREIFSRRLEDFESEGAREARCYRL